MASKRQTQANQKNAQLSTGPTTPEGKAVCAANAITHGFSAQAAVLPSETAAEFQSFLAAFEEEFQPQTALERSLVRHLADADWRLRRAATFESAVLLQPSKRHVNPRKNIPMSCPKTPTSTRSACSARPSSTTPPAPTRSRKSPATKPA
jgi:hypothetical protein